MPALADLKTRIATEMVRDDLLDDLAAQLLIHIQRACEYYADERFWFNSIITSANTAAGVDTVAVPATVRRVDRLTIPAQYRELQELGLDQIEQLTGTVLGVPDRYAYFNDNLKLYAVPDAVYALQITGLAQIAAPVNDGDTSVWTNEAQDLIVGRTKETLYRAQFRDQAGAGLAKIEADEARAKLRRETTRRLKMPLRSYPPMRGFNVYSD